jgi:hypothetical protein
MHEQANSSNAAIHKTRNINVGFTKSGILAHDLFTLLLTATRYAQPRKLSEYKQNMKEIGTETKDEF